MIEILCTRCKKTFMIDLSKEKVAVIEKNDKTHYCNIVYCKHCNQPLFFDFEVPEDEICRNYL